MTGQYIPGDSLLHRLDARTKIICLLLLLTAVVSCFHFSGYLFLFCVILGIALLSKLPFPVVFGMIRRLWLFFLFIFLMNALFFEGVDIVFRWHFIRIYTEGVRQGFSIAFNVFLIMILSQVLTGTTTPINLTSALSSLLKPLRIIGVPTEEVAMILSVAMQFIPTLLDEAQNIKKAQTARGARFESKRLREKIGSFFPLLIPIFLAAFRRADELSIAMEARGYKNAHDRTKKAGKPLSLTDYAALLICFIICCFQIVIKFRLEGN